MEMLNAAMGVTAAGIPDEESLWLEDEAVLLVVCLIGACLYFNE